MSLSTKVSSVDSSFYAPNYGITAAEIDSATKISNPKEEVDENYLWDITRKEFINLSCPFPWKINEHKEAASQATSVWAKESGLPPCEKYIFDLLIAGDHPNCSFEMLFAFGCLLTWIFVYDDKVETKLCKDPDKLNEFNQKNIEVLRGKLNAKGGDDVLTKAIQDLREKFDGISENQWRARFIRDVAAYFNANHLESVKTKEGRIPEMDEYLQLRLHTSALYPLFDLCELAEGVEISDEVFNSEYMQALRETCNKWIFLSNDLISYPKEANGIANNIIHGLKEKCSLEEAIAKARDFCNAEMKKIQDLTDAMPSSYTQNEKKYIDGLLFWVRSSYEWSLQTPRYKKPNPELNPVNQKV